jgi:hypothetical protein
MYRVNIECPTDTFSSITILQWLGSIPYVLLQSAHVMQVLHACIPTTFNIYNNTCNMYTDD